MDFTTVIWAVVVLGALAIVFGLILAVAAKVFEVEVDPRLPEIQACLAGANCGGCGYPGCGGCAEAILAGKAPINACAPAGAEGAAKIAAIMGMEAPTGEKMVAHVLCNGGVNAVKNFEYRGVNDCLAATKVLAGDALACKYGCLGFGSCVAACKFDAIHVGENGAAVVDKEKCTNCGAKDIKHSDIEVTQSGMEKVTVIYTGDSIPSIRMIFFFSKDCEDVAIRVFDIVKLPENRVEGFFKVVNEANRRFRFFKFVLDTNDNTVQAEMDAAFRTHDVGEICLELMSRCVDICDKAYPDFMKALWA